jgi:glycyl-tRNA synthetase
VTVDFQSLEDQTVTIRDRDSMQQERILASELEQYVREKSR